MKKIIKSIAIIISVLILTTFLFGKVFSRQDRPAGLIYAVGGIEVDFATDNWPFFEENFLPGESVSKTVTVINDSGQLQRVGFRMDNERGYFLAIPLLIKITDKTTGEIYYGGSNGKPLFFSYVWPMEIKLFNLSPGEEKELEVEIIFTPQAGNIFQGDETRFDFSLGFIGRIFPRWRFLPFFR